MATCGEVRTMASLPTVQATESPIRSPAPPRQSCLLAGPPVIDHNLLVILTRPILDVRELCKSLAGGRGHCAICALTAPDSCR